MAYKEAFAGIRQKAAKEKMRKSQLEEEYLDLTAPANPLGWLEPVLTLGGAIVGGIYGGPAGAQAGAALGSTVGGGIGGLTEPERENKESKAVMEGITDVVKTGVGVGTGIAGAAQEGASAEQVMQGVSQAGQAVGRGISKAGETPDLGVAEGAQALTPATAEDEGRGWEAVMARFHEGRSKGPGLRSAGIFRERV